MVTPLTNRDRGIDLVERLSSKDEALRTLLEAIRMHGHRTISIRVLARTASLSTSSTHRVFGDLGGFILHARFLLVDEIWSLDVSERLRLLQELWIYEPNVARFVCDPLIGTAPLVSSCSDEVASASALSTLFGLDWTMTLSPRDVLATCGRDLLQAANRVAELRDDPRPEPLDDGPLASVVGEGKWGQALIDTVRRQGSFTMDDVATEAGVSVSTLYRHHTQATLTHEIIAPVGIVLLDGIDRISNDPVDRLIVAADRYERLVDGQPWVGRLLGSSLLGGSERRPLHARRTLFTTWIEDQVAELYRENRLTTAGVRMWPSIPSFLMAPIVATAASSPDARTAWWVAHAVSVFIR